MTDITKLTQSHELLIANGNETANLLRHLANNEIDSDYFAVVSECESYGRETEAELSITDFALRAACYVDELVEALEKARQRIGKLEQKHCGGSLMERELAHSEVINKLMSEIDNRDSRIAELDAELEREREKSRRVMSRIAELEASHAKLRDAMAAIHNTIRMDGAYTPLAAILNAAKRAHEESAGAAGIKWEGE